MLNYCRFKSVGGQLKVKPNVIPHKFEGTHLQQKSSKTQHNIESEGIDALPTHNRTDELTQDRMEDICPFHQEDTVLSESHQLDDQLPKKMYDSSTQTDVMNDTSEKTRPLATKQRLSIKKFETLCLSMRQIEKRKFLHHSKQVQVNMFKNCEIRPKVSFASVACSPVRQWKVTHSANFTNVQQDTFNQENECDGHPIQAKQHCETDKESHNERRKRKYEETDDSEDDPSYTPSDTEEELDFEDEEKQNSLRRTRRLIEKAPRLYIGLDKKWISVISILSYKINYRSDKETSFNATDVVYLILRKLRLNECFQIWGHEFGISREFANRIFNKFPPFVADHFGELVYWPST